MTTDDLIIYIQNFYSIVMAKAWVTVHGKSQEEEVGKHTAQMQKMIQDEIDGNFAFSKMISDYSKAQDEFIAKALILDAVFTKHFLEQKNSISVENTETVDETSEKTPFTEETIEVDEITEIIGKPKKNKKDKSWYKN